MAAQVRCIRNVPSTRPTVFGQVTAHARRVRGILTALIILVVWSEGFGTIKLACSYHLTVI